MTAPDPADVIADALVTGLDAAEHARIWKPWWCQNCGEKHPADQIICDKVRPYDEAAE